MIKKITGELFPSSGNIDIKFNANLNIIAGGNGVGKTNLLKKVQDEAKIQNLRVHKFDPKRNAAKEIATNAQNVIRQDINFRNNSLSSFLQTIQDDGVQSIISISSSIINFCQEKVDKEEKNRPEATNEASDFFSIIVGNIFPHFKFKVVWNLNEMRHDIFLIKSGISLNPEQISTGENAIISLIFALYFLKDSTDVILIDEPEIHLNWSLEEKLFNFLHKFCTENKIQIICVTHSRVCLTSDFKDFTQFLFLDNNQLTVSDTPNEEIKKNLSGEIVKLVQGVTINDKLIYCEDKTSKLILEKLSEKLKLDWQIQIAGNCSNVKNLSKSFKKININNVFFLIDGDNQKITHQDSLNYVNLIQLNKYCIENYFLDLHALNNIDERQDKNKQIKEIIIEIINQTGDSSFKILQQLISINSQQIDYSLLNYIDASKLLDRLAIRLDLNDKNKLIANFIEINKEEDIRNIFAEIVNI